MMWSLSKAKMVGAHHQCPHQEGEVKALRLAIRVAEKLTLTLCGGHAATRCTNALPTSRYPQEVRLRLLSAPSDHGSEDTFASGTTLGEVSIEGSEAPSLCPETITSFVGLAAPPPLISAKAKQAQEKPT